MKRALVWAIIVSVSVATGALLAQTTADKSPGGKIPVQDTASTVQEVTAELGEIKALLNKQEQTLSKIHEDVNPGFVKIVAQELAVDFVKDLLQPGTKTHAAGLVASVLSILIGIVKLWYSVIKLRKSTTVWNKVSNGAIVFWLIAVGVVLLLTQSQTQVATYNSAPTEKLEKLTGIMEQLSKEVKSTGRVPAIANNDNVLQQLAAFKADLGRVDERLSHLSASSEAWHKRIEGKMGYWFQSALILITMVLAGYCAFQLWEGNRTS